MMGNPFDRDRQALWYAQQHAHTDPAIEEVWYLPKNAPEREIRLIEVNSDIPEMIDECLEPIDFGMERGTLEHHVLALLDVTPDQMKKILGKSLKLPSGWTLEDARKIRVRSVRTGS